jgi:hypothetical protein
LWRFASDCRVSPDDFRDREVAGSNPVAPNSPKSLAETQAKRTLEADGKPVVLHQQTDSPESDKVRLVVQCDQPVQFEPKLIKTHRFMVPAVAALII